jgi:hypothetical protein
MLSHADMLWDLAKQHQRDMIADADDERLLASARRHRRASRRHRHE